MRIAKGWEGLSNAVGSWFSSSPSKSASSVPPVTSSLSSEIKEDLGFWDHISDGVIYVFAKIARFLEAVWNWIDEKVLSWVVDERKKYPPQLEKWINHLIDFNEAGVDLAKVQRQIVGLFMGFSRALREEIQKLAEVILSKEPVEEALPRTFEALLASQDPKSHQILLCIALDLQCKYSELKEKKDSPL